MCKTFIVRESDFLPSELVVISLGTFWCRSGVGLVHRLPTLDFIISSEGASIEAPNL